jgi:hypothetical protein
MPPSVIIFTVFPTAERQTNVAAIVAGTTNATTIVTRQLLRKTRRTIMARRIPITMLSRVARMEL